MNPYEEKGKGSSINRLNAQFFRFDLSQGCFELIIYDFTNT